MLQALVEDTNRYLELLDAAEDDILQLELDIESIKDDMSKLAASLKQKTRQLETTSFDYDELYDRIEENNAQKLGVCIRYV